MGLADKAVAESRERVRAALAAIGLALPPKVITVNLSPADLPKEGSHYDLPIALCLLAAIGATDAEALSHYVAVGELCFGQCQQQAVESRGRHQINGLIGVVGG